MTIVARTQPGPDDPAIDIALVARVARGDVDALGLLYDRCGTQVHSLAHLVCGGGPAVADVVRDVFLDVQRWAGTYDPAHRSVATWLLTLTHHRAVAEVRRGDARTPADDHPPASAALDALAAPERRALELAYFGAHTQREVAAILGVDLDTVRARTVAAVTDLADHPLGRDPAPDLERGLERG